MSILTHHKRPFRLVISTYSIGKARLGQKESLRAQIYADETRIDAGPYDLSSKISVQSSRRNKVYERAVLAVR